ncbi:DNA polymerase III subunit beta [Paenibacillus tarimensis]
MLFSLKQPTLNSALQHIAASISARPVIPILAGVKVQADEQEIILTACNSTMTLQYRIPVDNDTVTVKKAGTAVISARYVTDIIRNLQEDVVTFEEIKDKRICIRSGRAVYRLSTLDPDEFPVLDDIEIQRVIEIDNSSFRKMVRQVSFAAAASETRMILTGILFHSNGHILRLAASDGIRFASHTLNLNLEMLPPVVVPAKNVHDFSKMLSDFSGRTEISMGDCFIRFTSDNFTMQSTLIQGIYPSIDKLIPNTFSGEITLVTSELLNAIERVTLLSGDANLVGLRLSPAGAELFARSIDIGDVIEALTVEEIISGTFTISFNGKYMRDIIRAIDSKHVHLKFTGKDKPIVIQSADVKHAQYILTPIRTSNS